MKILQIVCKNLMSIVEQEQEDEAASCPLQAWPGGEGVALQGWGGSGRWVYSFCFSFTVSSLRPNLVSSARCVGGVSYGHWNIVRKSIIR